MPYLRIDRPLSDYQWIKPYPTVVLTLAILGLDHALVLPNIGYIRLQGKHITIKFEAKWILDASFSNLVKDIWSKYIRGSHVH